MSDNAAPHLKKTVLGSFELLSVLGQGSFAVAYVARQIGTDRRAVVKIAHGHLIHSAQGRMVRNRFASEVRAATRVTHPNLVTIYTAGETDDGLPALAMEYLEGETLGERLRRGEWLTFDELFRGVAQLASALQRVHANHIVHRDVSPENVFLSQGHDGFQVKLLDFGIARLQDLASSGTHAVGTPLYMALEQMMGQATTASDVYSLGALLWWCLTGEQLFGHLGEFVQLVYQLQTQTEPPDARRGCPTMPAPVATLVASMLHQQASRRPSMGQFLAEWSALEGTLRSWWTSTSTGRSVAVLMARGPAADALAEALQQRGHTVLWPEPRVSTLLSIARLGAVVIDAEMTSPDPLSLARMLESELPGVRLCAVSTRPFASAWMAASMHTRVLLPEQLAQLCDDLRQGPPGSVRAPATGSREFAQRALGEMPDLIAGLEESLAHGDSATAVFLCESVERVAHLASLGEMVSLARTFRVLLSEHAVDDPMGFVDELKRSFHDSFAALLALSR